MKETSLSLSHPSLSLTCLFLSLPHYSSKVLLDSDGNCFGADFNSTESDVRHLFSLSSSSSTLSTNIWPQVFFVLSLVSSSNVFCSWVFQCVSVALKTDFKLSENGFSLIRLWEQKVWVFLWGGKEKKEMEKEEFVLLDLKIYSWCSSWKWRNLYGQLGLFANFILVLIWCVKHESFIIWVWSSESWR